MKHTCIICFKSFCKSWTLRRHLRIHDRETRRHTCPVCHKHFGRIDNFYRHAKTLHEGLILTPLVYNPLAGAVKPSTVRKTWEATGIRDKKKTPKTKGKLISIKEHKDFTVRVFSGIPKARQALFKRTACSNLTDTWPCSNLTDTSEDEARPTPLPSDYDTPCEDELWYPASNNTISSQIAEIDARIIMISSAIYKTIKPSTEKSTLSSSGSDSDN